MDANKLTIRAETTTARWTQAQINTELDFLKSRSQAFNSVIKEIPSSLYGRNIDSIVVTDSAEVFPSKKWLSGEQTWFNRESGTLYIGINPNKTLYNQADNRPLTVGELIAHGMAHFTTMAQGALVGDFTELASERIAVDYSNRVASEFGLSRSAAFKLGDYGYGPLFCTIQDPSGNFRAPTYLNRCFLRGTEILLQDTKVTQIEKIAVGDFVMSFNDISEAFPEPLSPKKVVNIFRNISQNIVDLRGLYCTPGHLFLTIGSNLEGFPQFASISNILRNDGTIIDKDCKIIRARTGATIKSKNDAVVYVRFYEHSDIDQKSKCRIALVRAGIPIIPILSDPLYYNNRSMTNLLDIISSNSILIDENGKLKNSDGKVFDACDWPDGTSPFDTHEQRNWIVEVDGQPYTPPWISELNEEYETTSTRSIEVS